MKILVDADSCPKLAREAVLRASKRTGITAIFAANRLIPGIEGETVIMEICPNEEGAADNKIVELALPGDFALTRDIPLASRLVEKEIIVIDDRGQIYTKENIKERLSIRNFILELTENGFRTMGSATYGKKELKAFADSFDRTLTKLMRQSMQIKNTIQYNV